MGNTLYVFHLQDFKLNSINLKKIGKNWIFQWFSRAYMTADWPILFEMDPKLHLC